MKRIPALLLALAALGACPARAAPPTVVPSPGYDARLQEQRAALAAREPAISATRKASRHHTRRSRTH
ncbi:hypothetical protein [Bradyrhizobium lablabi]|uniref:hypothetical protein n=1 Tax=Bradyrhizobium lablabi TaxID=722472 RepID=UPI001BAE1ACD|nr:hypothetical protein [Bradyrhizobium lablabi]MBR0692062.1 hypothetical protein [Bradyrhizobium lablabi]